MKQIWIVKVMFVVAFMLLPLFQVGTAYAIDCDKNPDHWKCQEAPPAPEESGDDIREVGNPHGCAPGQREKNGCVQVWKVVGHDRCITKWLPANAVAWPWLRQMPNTCKSKPAPQPNPDDNPNEDPGSGTNGGNNGGYGSSADGTPPQKYICFTPGFIADGTISQDFISEDIEIRDPRGDLRLTTEGLPGDFSNPVFSENLCSIYTRMKGPQEKQYDIAEVAWTLDFQPVLVRRLTLTLYVDESPNKGVYNDILYFNRVAQNSTTPEIYRMNVKKLVPELVVRDAWNATYDPIRGNLAYSTREGIVIHPLPFTRSRIVLDNAGRPQFNLSTGDLYHVVDGYISVYGMESNERANLEFPGPGTDIAFNESGDMAAVVQFDNIVLFSVHDIFVPIREINSSIGSILTVDVAK